MIKDSWEHSKDGISQAALYIHICCCTGFMWFTILLLHLRYIRIMECVYIVRFVG